MNLTVASIGAKTKNDNRIVKLQSRKTVETALGSVRKSTTYYMAVQHDTIKVAVNDEVEIDLDLFRQEKRPFVMEDGSLPKDKDGNDICDSDGNPLILTWLHLQ